MKFSKEEITEKLKALLVDAGAGSEEAIARCGADTSLVEDLGLSSVNMLYMVIAIEETFEVEFDDVSVSSFKLLGDVTDYIAKKLS